MWFKNCTDQCLSVFGLDTITDWDFVLKAIDTATDGFSFAKWNLGIDSHNKYIFMTLLWDSKDLRVPFWIINCSTAIFYKIGLEENFHSFFWRSGKIMQRAFENLNKEDSF